MNESRGVRHFKPKNGPKLYQRCRVCYKKLFVQTSKLRGICAKHDYHGDTRICIQGHEIGPRRVRPGKQEGYIESENFLALA